MNPNLTNRPETASHYRVDRSFAGERTAQDVVVALVKAHSCDGGAKQKHLHGRRLLPPVA